jgi:nitrogenase molybdenum-iron protein alpha chain
VPFRQLHSWDYSGPYHGYDGFAVFAKDMDLTLNNPCWNMMQPPWQEKPAKSLLKDPLLKAA